MCFKYNINFELKGKRRGASITIKTEQDWDIADVKEMVDFQAKHNCIPRIEKMFGKGSVISARVTEKIQIA